MSLLGSLMLDKDAFTKVGDFLEPRDFYKEQHQRIYEAVVALFERRESIDVLSVTARLKEKNQLEGIGGSGYLTELINTVPTASHVLSYAKQVQKKRVLRDLISASSDIGMLGYNESEDPEVLVDQAEARIFAIAQNVLSQNFVLVKDVLEEAFERIDRLSKNEKGTRGVPTGFADLDNILSGLQNSDLVILAARPSMGKSALALDIARRVATQHKIPVGLFSLEMSKDQVIDRLLASEAGVDLWRLRTGKLSSQGAENDFERIQRAMGTLSEAPIFIDDSPAISVMELRAKARRLKAHHDIKLIILDYLQLMRGSSGIENRQQEISEISRCLKALARELSVPIVAISQLSRAVESRTDHRPQLSDLRESGAIEQDADVVVLILREEYYNPTPDNQGIAEVIIAKQRNGPVGSMKLAFVKEYPRFENIARIE